MDGQLDDEALLRLLSAVVLHWWRECDEPGELAAFLEMPVDVVVMERPRRYCCGACRTAAHRVTKVNRTAQDDAGYIIYQAGGVTAQGAGAGLARKDGN